MRSVRRAGGLVQTPQQVEVQPASALEQSDGAYENNQPPRAMNAATNTIATTSATSAALIRQYPSIENRGRAVPTRRRRPSAAR
jgi:hypothetical protein